MACNAVIEEFSNILFIALIWRQAIVTWFQR
jgi:hypothetical protein